MQRERELWVNREDCDFEGRDAVCLNAFGTLFTVTVKLRGFEHTLLRHTGQKCQGPDPGCGDDPLHTLSEDDYLNEPQIFPPDST